MTPATKLKLQRQKTGLTQVEVAKASKITEISYQRIEYGKQKPNVDTAILIANTLNSTVEELFQQKINTDRIKSSTKEGEICTK